MSNFLGVYLSIYLICEDRLSYYHFGSVFLGPYTTIAIILALVILGQTMIRWLDGKYLGVHHIDFVKVGAVPIVDVG